MSLQDVNEGSTSFITATFKNKIGNNVAPTSADYRVDQVASDGTVTQVRDWTSIPTPAAIQEITILATDNLMIDETLDSEERVVTVRADYGADGEVTEDFEYTLKNMLGT